LTGSQLAADNRRFAPARNTVPTESTTAPRSGGGVRGGFQGGRAAATVVIASAPPDLV